MDALLQDLRYGARVLARRPGFTLVAVLAIALGVGANTAVFSLIDALLISPLHFKELDRLVMLWNGSLKSFGRESISPADFADWRTRNTAFEHLAAINWADVNLTASGEPEKLQGFQVSPDFFDALGVEAAYGRTFLPEEETPGRHQVVVLSHNLWQRRFASDPDIVGQTVKLDGSSFSVVGIMPPDFEWPTSAELWMPLALTNDQMSVRHNHYLMVMGRLKRGITLEQAQAEMSIVARQLEQEYPQTNTGRAINVANLAGQNSEDFTRSFLLILAAAVGFVLLIACANVANLQLARAAGRYREIAIRSALGASRRRVVRQLLTESVMMSLAGAALGVLLAMWGVDLIKSSIPADQAKFVTGLKYMSVDGRALLFTLALAIAAGIVSGLAPALQASKPDLNETLKEGGRGSTSGAGRRHLRSALVIAEISLALVLTVGTGLMVKGFARLLENQRQGFDSQNVLTLRLTLPDSKYKERHQRVAFYDELLKRVGSLPEVESAAAVNSLLSSGNWSTTDFLIEGRPATSPGDAIGADYQIITPAYFSALRIPLLGGREFTAQDGEQTAPVVIISQNLARRFWPEEDPIGKRIKIGVSRVHDRWHTIVGVAGDVKQFMFDKGPRLTLYVPHAQSPHATMSLVLRTSVAPLDVAGAVRAQALAIDGDQPLYNIKSMEEVIRDHVAGLRLGAVLMAIFGIMALILSAVGVYSVMAYSVTQRTHEIGIRMALGAESGDILRLIVAQALRMAGIGLAIGLPIAYALTRVMASAMLGVVALDLSTFVGFTLLLAAAALLSGYIPARRATRVDPMIALRYE